jgi:hypothetical protein
MTTHSRWVFRSKEDLKAEHNKNMRLYFGKYPESLRQYGEGGYEESNALSGRAIELRRCYARSYDRTATTFVSTAR